MKMKFFIIRFPLALAVLIVAGAGIQQACAVTGIFNTLTLTENSSTSLLLSYSGASGSFSMPTPGSLSDMWSFDVLSHTISLDNFEFAFQEPENAALINVVSHSTTMNPSTVFVESDELLATYTGGVVITLSGPIIGSDNGTPIELSFVVNAAGAEAGAAPDRGSTLSLLALSLMALPALRRLPSLRLG